MKNNLNLLIFILFLSLLPGLTLAADDLNGMVKFPGGCSGSLIRLNEAMSAKAVVLTNGHCVTSEKLGTFTFNKPLSGHKLILYSGYNRPISVTTNKIIYSTMTGTDIGLIELTSSYASLARKGVEALSLADVPAPLGKNISMTSGFFGTVSLCKIDSIAYVLREGDFTWNQSYGYDECQS